MPEAHAIFKGKRIYQHATFHVNFTTYDLQCDQDIIHHSSDHLAIMVSTAEGTSGSPWHPWMYARVLGIFHAEVLLPDKSEVTHIEFLWVRWMERDNSTPAGLAARQLKRISFMPIASAESYGFIDPAAVIRGCHLIPACHHGRAPPSTYDSIAQDSGGDWNYYYVMW